MDIKKALAKLSLLLKVAAATQEIREWILKRL
jgi:hypothetical protein